MKPQRQQSTLSVYLGRGDPVYSQSTIQLSRVTSLRDSDYPRYSYKDSTIRIRTIVVSRSETSISDDTTYWVEVGIVHACHCIALVPLRPFLSSAYLLRHMSS